MKIKLFCFLLFFSSLSAQVSFQKVPTSEVWALQGKLLTSYSEELFRAGLFKNREVAREAAEIEWQEEEKDPNKEFLYYYLSSEDFSTHYGYLIYSIEGRTAYIQAIYLEEAHQGQGLGKKALAGLETLVKESDVETIGLFVFAGNERAFALYTKMGYTIENKGFNGDTFFGYYMRKSLRESLPISS